MSVSVLLQEHDLDFKDQGIMVLGCGPYHIGKYNNRHLTWLFMQYALIKNRTIACICVVCLAFLPKRLKVATYSSYSVTRR